jgi:hypothetical protein
MIIMHGLFDLKDDVKEAEFRQSFDLFSEHLNAADMVLDCRFMRHQAHEGYNSRPPSTEYYVSMEFTDMNYAQRCWDYIEEHEEPLDSIHTAVFSKIQNFRFFLSRDV